ncbi:MAG: hypothetical protein U0736_08750 [Gemmataceae bacterium]
MLCKGMAGRGGQEEVATKVERQLMRRLQHTREAFTVRDFVRGGGAVAGWVPGSKGGWRAGRPRVVEGVRQRLQDMVRAAQLLVPNLETG